MLKEKDTIALVACSNGLSKNKKDRLDELVKLLSNIGLNVKLSPYIYAKNNCFSGTAKERGEYLMELFKDKEVKAIFDISGGDIANGVLEYLDFDVIKSNSKLFFGYSDLSVLLNAIYAKTGVITYNYQIRHLVGKYSEKMIKAFTNTIFYDGDDLFNANYEFHVGNNIEGIVVGGNIRCLLKLAGTEYMPDFNNKVIFLEGLSGDVAKMTTFLTQLKNIGVFKNCRGILLGTFTEMEREGYTPTIIELVKEIVNDGSIAIAKTSEIGHGEDSKSIAIGKEISLRR